jgi:hypothetical protein
VGTEYVKFFRELAVKPGDPREISLAASDASWLDDAEKSTLRAEFDAEIDALESQL